MYIDFDHYRGAQLADELEIHLRMQEDLLTIAALKPTLSVDGNQYCYIIGQIPEPDCVVGFGDTPMLAMKDFCNNFRTQKVK